MKTHLDVELKASLSQAIFQLRCFNHILNLSAHSATSESKMLISSIRKMIVSIRKSCKKRKLLSETCTKLNLEHKTLILDVETRWNSTMYMLKRLLELKPVMRLVQFLAIEKIAFDKLFKVVEIDWDSVAALHWLLALFEPLTLATESERVPTLGLVVPLFNKLLDSLEHIAKWDVVKPECQSVPVGPDDCSILPNTNAALKKLKPAVLTTIQAAANAAFIKTKTYYDKSDDFYTMATILDPRFKLAFYESDQSEGTEACINVQKKYGLLVTHFL
jgi:hypothetical protein